jgi:hypothetical protein
MQRWLITTAIWLSPVAALASNDRLGLSLRIDNGESSEVQIVGNNKRFVQELDLVATASTPDDQGIQPLIDDGDFADLNWNGVEQTDEDWHPDGAGGFTRQRFFRNAAWMEQPSAFLIFQRKANGQLLPELPWIVLAGTDDHWSVADTSFVRRFSARQVTTGCTAVGDCAAATGHIAQGLMQLREAQYPSIGDHKVRENAASLLVLWTADPFNPRVVPIDRINQNAADFGPGFGVDFEVLTPPGNGQYYLPGEAITFKLLYTDGAGNLLHEGELPTFADFLDGGTDSGLRYLDVTLNPTLYYALKHREGNILFSMTGPTDLMRANDYTIPLVAFFGPQVQAAFADEQGFSSVAAGVPSLAVIFGGQFDPTLWNTPVSDEVVLTVPDDAQPGTYIVATKARRDYAGEAINKGAVHRIQVGSNEVTEWEPTTGNCTTCHTGETALANVGHGIGDRESCLSGCHTAFEIEPDAPIDYRVHYVHTRSDRFPADPDDCSTCHLDDPEGIPRGYPGFVYPFE